MNLKKLVKKYWRDFELIAFHAVKSQMPQELIISEKITQSIKDGGYDGEIVLLSNKGDMLQILLEAKLRSNVNVDLPLQDFAKALIIAIVKQADMIYIVTNLHYSDKTIDMLKKYSIYANLDIEIMNGKTVKKFIENHVDLLNNINIELKEFLTNYTNSIEEQFVSSKDSRYISIKNSNYSVLKDYNAILNVLIKYNGIQIVTGSVGSGKSYYIKKLCETIKNQNIKIQTIDLSKCLTYRSFYLELLEKSFGLSLELFDLAGDDIFDSALSKIITTNNNNDNINMLKFIFSRIDSLPYDYSVIFKLMVKFYSKLYNLKRKFNPIIIAFENIVYASLEVLQLFQFFLDSGLLFPCIIELTDDDYCCSIKNDQWNFIKHNIIQYSKHEPIHINSWKRKQARNYLQENISGLSLKEINKIINKFGTNPSELSKLLMKINDLKLYNFYPKDLLYNKVMEIDLSDNYRLYNKCFEYIVLLNSDMQYVYVFLYLFNGKINIELLKKYFGNINRLYQCRSILINSNLFIVEKENIEFKSNIINECFLEYCKLHLFDYIAKPIIEFIDNNKEYIHLSREMELELDVRKNFFISKYEYVQSLILLGNEYLNLSQLDLANKKFQEVLEIIENSSVTINLSVYHEVLLFLGLIEAEIWEIGEKEIEIEGYLNHIESIIKTSNSLDFPLQILRYYILKFQFYHTQGKNNDAFSVAKKGVKWVNSNNLYSDDLEQCGKMWRFYAIATKELYNDIYMCLNIFEEGVKHCKESVKFLFGQIIHKNMIIDNCNIKERLELKLNNYNPLFEKDSKLSIDEYLHYRVNIAALHFMQKDYNLAQKEYEELLRKSDIFNITREKMRILNDMANICWIKKDYCEARKKYYIAKRTAELSGCARNHWPILVNLVSFEIFNKQYSAALQLHNKVQPYLLEECENLIHNTLGFEKINYCRAAFIIHLKNLLIIYKKTNKQKRTQVFIDIKTLLSKSSLMEGQKVYNINDVEKRINELSLNNSEYDHNGLYLIKD